MWQVKEGNEEAVMNEGAVVGGLAAAGNQLLIPLIYPKACCSSVVLVCQSCHGIIPTL